MVNAGNRGSIIENKTRRFLLFLLTNQTILDPDNALHVEKAQ